MKRRPCLVDDRNRLRALPTFVFIILAALLVLPIQGAYAQETHCQGLPSELPVLSMPVLADDGTVLSGQNVTAWVQLLTQPSLLGRDASSPETQQVAGLLASYFHEIGLTTLDEDNYCQRFKTAFGLDQNVVAHRLSPSSGPTTPAVIIGAHYDAQGTGWDGTIYPGADDNASGVAALMEVARALSQTETQIDIVFVAFGAEEIGMWGSEFFVVHPTISLDRVHLMINLDQVGRQLLEGQWIRMLLGEPVDALGYVISDQQGGKIGALLEQAQEMTGTTLFGIPETVFQAMSYAADSVPFSSYTSTVFLSSSMHDDYHQPTDTADRIDYDQIVRAADAALSLVEVLSDTYQLQANTTGTKQ